MRTFVSAVIAAGFALASSFAAAQETPSSAPQMPATPSLNQKGSDDMSKPAGASKSAESSKPSGAGRQVTTPIVQPPAKTATPRESMEKPPAQAGLAKTGTTKHPAMKNRMTGHAKPHARAKHHVKMPKHPVKRKRK